MIDDWSPIGSVLTGFVYAVSASVTFVCVTGMVACSVLLQKVFDEGSKLVFFRKAVKYCRMAID